MPYRFKGVMIVLDGLGDRTCPALGGVTPLEAAETPNFDRLISAGIAGLVDPFIPGVPVGTHTGTGALFGLAPRDLHRLSRGPVEAAGVGIPQQAGDVFLRVNFATLEAEAQGLTVRDRRAGRIREGTRELADAVNAIPLDYGVSATLFPATQHRAVLRLSGPGLSAAISDTDPGDVPENNHRLLASQPLNIDDKASERTAQLLNHWLREAFKRLHDHPLNKRRIRQRELPASGILTRGAGMAFNIESFINHLGLKTAVVTGERTVAGLGKLLNFSVFTDPRFTASMDTDLSAKVAVTRQALADHNLVFLHIKSPDICSHDSNPLGKKAVLERIDDAILALIFEDLVIAVTADHSTDSNTGQHCGDPVPSFYLRPTCSQRRQHSVW